MNFTLIILTIILIIVIIIFSFIFINKLNKRRISQNTDQKCSKDNKTESVNISDDYPSFSDQIHSPINLDRSLLEIEEVGEKQSIEEVGEKQSIKEVGEKQLIKEDKEQFDDDDNIQIQLISNSGFIF